MKKTALTFPREIISSLLPRYTFPLLSSCDLGSEAYKKKCWKNMWVIVFTNSWSTVDAFFLFILLPIPRGYLFIRLLPSCRADCWRKRKEKKPRVVIKVAHKIEWATIKFPRSIEPLWALTYSTDNIPFPFRILFFFVSLGECDKGSGEWEILWESRVMS